jgi:uncharacterized membrane protein YfhO
MAVIVVIGIFGGFMPGLYKNLTTDTRADLLDNSELMPKSDEEFYRIDTSPATLNFHMIWGYSSNKTFHSVVPASIFEYYHGLGIARGVKSVVDVENFYVRGLLSVKYFLIESDTYLKDRETNREKIILFGSEYKDKTRYYDIYENKYYVPMGFIYDTYITPDDWRPNIDEKSAANLLLNAMLLTDEQAEKYGDLMTRKDSKRTYKASGEQYIEDCIARAETSCYSFQHDGNGFTAKTVLPAENLVFFSVPYDEGWTAFVNGKPAEIEKVNFGFMAVLAPDGDSTIEFRYFPPGLKHGVLITALSLAMLFAYYLISKRLAPTAKQPKESAKNRYIKERSHELFGE